MDQNVTLFQIKFIDFHKVDQSHLYEQSLCAHFITALNTIKLFLNPLAACEERHQLAWWAKFLISSSLRRFLQLPAFNVSGKVYLFWQFCDVDLKAFLNII